ncbi:MAG TPA: ABC transporter permease [Candidatus Sulfotelmatobacter sp.]|nr:ABC transporter permease [Candidatus Sulfotelmatobacter sp.]
MTHSDLVPHLAPGGKGAASTPPAILAHLGDSLKRSTSLLGLILIGTALAFTSRHFLTFDNLLNVLLQNANIAILATGMTFVVILGEIDLSVGAVEAFGSVVAAYLMVFGHLGPVPAVAAALLVGTFCGFFSGFFVAYFRFHSFVSTLAVMGVARGLALIPTQGASIYGLPESFGFIGQGFIGPIAVPVILAAAVLATAHFVLTQTAFGTHVYAVGGNPEAARLAGINVGRVKLICLSAAGFCSALAGVIMASRLNSGQGTIGEADILDTIAAVVIGGTSLVGGIGTIGGTVVGVLIIGIIRNGLNLLGVSSFWQLVAIGLIIICAVLVDELRRMREPNR